MDYKVRLHPEAQAELDTIYSDILDVAGPAIAGAYVGGLYDLIDSFVTFPERGTVRENQVPGLRIIGFRRTASVAFVVEDDVVTILGVFRRGKNLTADLFEDRI